jgi:hypothetical protein
MAKERPLKENQLARLFLTAATLIALVVLVVALATKGTTNKMSVGPGNDQVVVESTKVKSVRDIGQWEFLTLTDEELVDSTASRLIGSDRQITRIYYGTLRLGLDLSELREDAVTMRGDTVDVALPPIKLLDKDFIDEARTTSFYEEGSWDQKSRAALYEKAKRQMLARCMTEENIHIAQAYAVDEIARVFQSMGYAYVDVHF